MFDSSKLMKLEGSGQRGAGERIGHGIVTPGQRANEGANLDLLGLIQHINCAERFYHL